MTQLELPNATVNNRDSVALWETSEAYTLPGVSEVDKEWMEGVPHAIVKVTFWVPKKGIGHCSIEAVVAPENILKKELERGRIKALNNAGQPMVEPGELVLYTDGGTGIRRQVVTLLQAADLIDVGHADLAENGKLGECRYDAPWTEWERYDESTMQGEINVPSFTKNHIGGQLVLRVMRGLRSSEYNDGENVTWYLVG